MLKSVPDFLFAHKTSDTILVLGQCPSTRTKPTANGTFVRLKKWMDHLDLPCWAFHNVIPNKANSYKMEDVDVEALNKAVEGKHLVIALGGFVSRVCKKHKIKHLKIDHPSPRNRKFNDPDYEAQMLWDTILHLKHNKDIWR